MNAILSSKPKHILIASTSSVYGANEDLPFKEIHKTDLPISIYAATKKSTESIAHSWSYIHNIPTTIFRFFTVYGPWGRPDMAAFKFIDAIIKNRPINVFNYGKVSRDFTYISDLIKAILLLIECPPGKITKIKNDSLSPVAPYRIVNIGNSHKVTVEQFINAFELAF